jgi:(R,R)-butanediol dehydrogenase/meso-butanediol dehydrogenase/diacetyl reductase
VFDGAGLVVSQVDDPVPGEGQLLLATHRAGICGTDLHADELGMPAGTILGHELCGEVIELGRGVERWQLGQLVAAMPVLGCGACGPCLSGDPARCRKMQAVGLDGPGAFAELVVVGARESFALPPELDAGAGALAEPLAIGLHLVHRALVHPLERVLVLGAGPIGLAVLAWLRHHGVRSVVASDPVAGRRELAARCGADVTVDPTTEDVTGVHRKATGARPDVVFDCAGGLLDDAMKLTRSGGRIMVAGYRSHPQPVDARLGLQKELTISFATWYSADEYRYTLESLAAGRLLSGAMVTDTCVLEDLPEAYDGLKRPNAQGKVQVAFAGGDGRR